MTSYSVSDHFNTWSLGWEAEDYICCSCLFLVCLLIFDLLLFIVVQSLSCVSLFATPWTAAHQAPLPSTIPWILLKFMSIESVILSNILSSASLFSFCLQSFLSSGSFPVSWLFASGGQSMRASASVLPVNIQGWFPLGLIGLISLQSKGPSRVFSSTTVQKHQFFNAQCSSWSSSQLCIWLLEKP